MIRQIQIDPGRMAAIAEALRREITKLGAAAESATAAMIDAAGELQRMADQFTAFAKHQAERQAQQQAELEKAIQAEPWKFCPCDNCKARRAAESTATPGSLN